MLNAHVRDPPHFVHGTEVRKTRGENFERSKPVSLTPVASHNTLKLRKQGFVIAEFSNTKIFLKVFGSTGFNLLDLNLSYKRLNIPESYIWQHNLMKTVPSWI